MALAVSLIQQAQHHLARGETAQGRALLRRAAWSQPDGGNALALLIQHLISSHEKEEALNLLGEAVASSALSAQVCDALAFMARQLDQHELSGDLYSRAVALEPEDPRYWHNLASSQRSLGRLEAAAAACQRALDLDPRDFPSLLLRSDLLPATEAVNHVAHLQHVLAAEPSDQAQMFAAYALGKELNDLQRFDEAFAAFALGSRVRRRNLAYDVRTDEAKFERIQQTFGADWYGAPSAAADPRHIFVIGLPRSGTTLVERLLLGLPGVRSNGETDNFSTALAQAAPAGRDVFQQFALAPPDRVAARYDELAGPVSSGGRIIEKLPLNYLYLGLIARALPGATLVVLRRRPLDSCFAMFRTLFGSAYPFSYDFDDLARYFAAYERLMRHWKDLLGERIVEVDYEALVSAPGAVASGLSARCGLDWSPDALDLSRRSSASLTASASQVRGEIYQRSAGLWRAYAAHLQPLAARLGDLGVEGLDSDS